MKKCSRQFIVILIVALSSVCSASEYWGAQLGQLDNSSYGLSAQVFLVNRTHLVIKDLTLNRDNPSTPMDYQFYASTATKAEPITEVYQWILHENGDYLLKSDPYFKRGFDGVTFVVKLPAIENGRGSNNKDWTFLGMISENHWHYLSAVKMNETDAPEPYCCIRDPKRTDNGIVGAWYGVKTGPIEVLDAKTLRIPNFSFQGSKPPDGWWFAGKGKQVKKGTGQKALILGSDTKDLHCAMTTDFANEDMTILLADGQTIYDIEFLSVYCYAVGVNFGHITFKVDQLVPPHIPSIQTEPTKSTAVNAWRQPRLLLKPESDDDVVDVVFMRGPSGGARARAMRGVCASLRSVWWVDGQLQPELWMVKGRTYRFHIRGGVDHPLYITNEPTGAFAFKPNHDKVLITNYFGGRGRKYGSECELRPKEGRKRDQDPDAWPTAELFAKTLQPLCHDGDKSFEWTVPRDAPNLLYYASFKAYHNGGPIRVCDEIVGDEFQAVCFNAANGIEE